MRSAILAIIIFTTPLWVLAGFSNAYKIDVTQYEKSFLNDGKFDKPVFENSSVIYEPGAFRIPYYTYIYALPPGLTADSVTDCSTYFRSISGSYNLSRIERAKTLSGSEEAAIEPSSLLLHKPVFISGYGESGGCVLVHVTIPSMLYDSSTNRIDILDSISFRFSLSPFSSSQQSGCKGIENILRGLLENSDEAYFENSIKSSSYLLDSIVEYVILVDTSDIMGMNHPELMEPLQRLAEWKTRTGILSRVFTLDYVEAMFSGAQTTEKIKSFITYMRLEFGTKYLLLVGEDDSDLDDARSIYAENDVGSWMPRYEEFVFDPFEDGYIDADTVITDYYFSDLNNDDYVDIKVGRLLFDEYVKAFSVCSLFVERIIKHESDPDTGYLGKMLLITENLYEGYPGKILAESVALYNPSGISEIKMYDEDGTYDDDAAISIMNSGVGIQMASSHGCEYAYVLNNKNSISISDIEPGFNSDQKTFFFLGIPCWIGAYDYDCLAEHMLCHPSGGAIGGLFNTRYGFGTIDYPGRSEWLTLQFIKMFSSTDLFRTGDLKAAMNDAAVKYLSLDPAAKWCSRAYNLFGDPTMILYGGEPQHMTVSHPPSVDSSGYFYVIATDSISGSPVSNASLTVTCVNDPLLYIRGITDVNGSAVFYIDPSNALDTMLISVVKKSYSVHMSRAAVILQPPERSIIISPFDDCAFSGLFPVLRFLSNDAQGDRLTYKIEIDDSPAFDSPLVFYTPEFNSGETVSYTPFGLAQSVLYFWRVSACDADGSGKFGELSETRCFHILPPSTAPYICSYKTDSIQFSSDGIFRISLGNDAATLSKKDYFIYERRVFSDFEYNMIDSSWAVLDSNFDNVKWHTGLTMQSALGGYEPPNSSTYYLYYSDAEIRGSKYKFSNEQVLSGPIFTGDCDSLFLSYSYGFYLKQSTENFNMYVSVFNGGSWSSWFSIHTIEGNSTGDRINNLSWLLPCDSMRFSFIYRNSGKKGGGVALDNILVTAVYMPDYDYGTLTSEKVSFYDLNSASPRNSWGRIEYEKLLPDDSILITVEYMSGDLWREIPDLSLPGNSSGFYSISLKPELDISSLSVSQYPVIRGQFKFFKRTGSAYSLPSMLSYSIGVVEQSATLTSSSSLRGRVMEGSIIIEWDSSPSSSSTLTREGGGYKVLPADINSGIYSDKDVKPGQVYTYRLKYNAGGREYTAGELRIKYSLSETVSLLKNISSGILTLMFSGVSTGGYSYSIYDISGRCIIDDSSFEVNGASVDLDLTCSKIPSGYYSLKIQRKGADILTAPLLIVR